MTRRYVVDNKEERANRIYNFKAANVELDKQRLKGMFSTKEREVKDDQEEKARGADT